MDAVTSNPEQKGSEPTSTVIGANVVVRGDIEGPTDLRVQGRVLGGIKVTGLILEEGAEVEGPVTAEAVVISGRVGGVVEAKAVSVQATGRIDGDVTYTSLQVDTGGRLCGRLTISDGFPSTLAEIGEHETRALRPLSEPAEPGPELDRVTARLRRAAE